MKLRAQHVIALSWTLLLGGACESSLGEDADTTRSENAEPVPDEAEEPMMASPDVAAPDVAQVPPSLAPMPTPQVPPSEPENPSGTGAAGGRASAGVAGSGLGGGGVAGSGLGGGGVAGSRLGGGGVAGSSLGGGGVGAVGGFESAGPAPRCPEDMPEASTPCETESQLCGYDPITYDDLHCHDCSGCRDRFLCTDGAWVRLNYATSCDLGPDPGCPSLPPDDFSACSDSGSACRWGTLLCQCTPCADPAAPIDGPPVWVCTSPDPECPGLNPGNGEGCDLPDDTWCEGYDLCFSCGPFTSAAAPLCRNGVWDADGHVDCQL